ncbi:hypothetical protein Tcan_06223 [Toxocara canis]|uniref:UPAR/Ly6 domain-containing protein n=1 Tax=Toxocara canis TaxID=6265 RepID=A0A0B2UWG2_TOXCA|nr:hypothetical protein Tcan_06223 [Toxocara canis]
MGVLSLFVLLFITSTLGLNCWKGTRTTTVSSVHTILDSVECTGTNNASYCSISFRTSNISSTETYSCDSAKQCKSNGWNGEKLYCCNVNLCNEKSSAAINKSFQLLFAGSALLVFAFRYSQY